METKFWTFDQNNSGGYFVKDIEKGVCEYVIIEANSPEEAWDRLSSIGSNVNGFWNYCSCCGERWYECYSDEGYDEPSIYGNPIHEETATYFRKIAFIHFLNGDIERVDFKNN